MDFLLILSSIYNRFAHQRNLMITIGFPIESQGRENIEKSQQKRQKVHHFFENLMKRENKYH